MGIEKLNESLYKKFDLKEEIDDEFKSVNFYEDNLEDCDDDVEDCDEDVLVECDPLDEDYQFPETDYFNITENLDDYDGNILTEANENSNEDTDPEVDDDVYPYESLEEIIEKYLTAIHDAMEAGYINMDQEINNVEDFKWVFHKCYRFTDDENDRDFYRYINDIYKAWVNNGEQDEWNEEYWYQHEDDIEESLTESFDYESNYQAGDKVKSAKHTWTLIEDLTENILNKYDLEDNHSVELWKAKNEDNEKEYIIIDCSDDEYITDDADTLEHTEQFFVQLINDYDFIAHDREDDEYEESLTEAREYDGLPDDMWTFMYDAMFEGPRARPAILDYARNYLSLNFDTDNYASNKSVSRFIGDDPRYDVAIGVKGQSPEELEFAKEVFDKCKLENTGIEKVNSDSRYPYRIVAKIPTDKNGDPIKTKDYFASMGEKKPVRKQNIPSKTYGTKKKNESYDSGNWELVKTKSVYDSDGFLTEYSMWYNKDTGAYNFIFGDSDIYTPDTADFDWEDIYDKDLADEWFDNYDGFGEEDEY